MARRRQSSAEVARGLRYLGALVDACETDAQPGSVAALNLVVRNRDALRRHETPRMPALIEERRGAKIQVSTESKSTPGLPCQLPAGRDRGNMDNNLHALLHVQSSLLMALCSTHPNPLELQKAFDFHLDQSKEKAVKLDETSFLIDSWARTFRARMQPPTASPTDSGQSPPPAD